MSGGKGIVPMEKAEIAIVGGGILGTVLAGFLAEGGAQVLLLDDGKGGGSTVNAGSLHVQLQSRFMRMYPDQVPAIERNLHLYPKAVNYWKELEKKLRADFDLKMTGGLMIAENQDQFEFLAGKCEREAELGLDVRMIERRELQGFAPYLGAAVFGAEHCAQEGKVNPLLANMAINKWAVAAGVTVMSETPVRSIGKSASKTGFELAIPSATIKADRVVLAAGGGNRELAAGLGLALPVVSEPLHMNITEPAVPIIGHLVQHADRPITLKQFSSGHVVIGGGWPAHLRQSDKYPTVELASIIGNTTLAQHIVPAVAPLRIIRTWAGINATTDGRPVLGEFSAMPGIYAAVSGDAGYTLGPYSAKILADIILGQPPCEDLSEFSPDVYHAV